MPRLRPRNNNLMPKELHDGILWKEEKAIRKAQLASLIENQKLKRKKSRGRPALTSKNMSTKGQIVSMPSQKEKSQNWVTKNKTITQLNYSKKLKLQNKIFAQNKDTQKIKHRKSGQIIKEKLQFGSDNVRYSLSPEYLNKSRKQIVEHNITGISLNNQTISSPEFFGKYHSEILDDGNLTPTKKKLYLAQRKFAQNDQNFVLINHNAILANPFHLQQNNAPQSFFNFEPAIETQLKLSRPGVIMKNGKGSIDKTFGRGITSVSNKCPPSVATNSKTHTTLRKNVGGEKNKVLPLHHKHPKIPNGIDNNNKNDVKVLNLNNGKRIGASDVHTKVDRQISQRTKCISSTTNDSGANDIDTADFLSWLYMRHLPDIPSHLKAIDNHMKTFIQKLEDSWVL